MNIEKVEKALSEYNQIKVSKYCNYLTKLMGEKDKSGKIKAWWIAQANDELLIQLFKEVAAESLNLDGEIVHLKYLNGIKVEYTYYAYINKVLATYPETEIDAQIVKEGDEFNFQKENGKINYTHNLGAPFGDKPIIGAYCIIKCSRGEFIEVMSYKELMRVRATAKTDYIWKAWEGEMIKKTIIKRALKVRFKDIVAKIDKSDNEGYRVEKEPPRGDFAIQAFEKLVEKMENKDQLMDKFLSLDINGQRNMYAQVRSGLKQGITEVVA
jgi:hypothetical protein